MFNTVKFNSINTSTLETDISLLKKVNILLLDDEVGM